MKKILSLDKIKWQTWALVFLMLLGTFLRTYHFHDWMMFANDQIRDAKIISSVANGESEWPLLGPKMSYTGLKGYNDENEAFHLGPIYYYFQIISAKFFGNHPDKFAYPDAFFSILSIALLYLFLRIYFDKNLSLGLAGIYAISAYFINYSRFAWNTNPIPFFVMLFLISLFKILEKNEEVKWFWVLSLGCALGIGFQLHAILMILFPATAFIIFLFSMKKNYLIWKKWTVVLLIFIALNASQIISEVQTNFSNIKKLAHPVVNDKQGRQNVGIITLSKLVNDVDCHIEANFFLPSSYGSKETIKENEYCSHIFVSPPSDGWVRYYFSDLKGVIDFAILPIGLAFSIIGYSLLIYYGKKKKEPTKKYFLRFIILYATLGFFIMLPLSQNTISNLRYFVFVFFMPFMFLGFLFEFLTQKLGQLKYTLPWIMAIIFGLLIFSNLRAISVAVNYLSQDKTTCLHRRAILGEVEPIVQDMATYLNGQKQFYLEKNPSGKYIPDAFIYLFKEQGVDLIETGKKNIPLGTPFFHLDCKKGHILSASFISNTDNIYPEQSANK